MRPLAEAAAILHGHQKADVALRSASYKWPLVPGYDAACLERQKPTHNGPSMSTAGRKTEG
jgi:hypothetical protein